MRSKVLQPWSSLLLITIACSTKVAADWIQVSYSQYCSVLDLTFPFGLEPAIAAGLVGSSVVVPVVMSGQPRRCLQSGSALSDTITAYEYASVDKTSINLLQCDSACNSCSYMDKLLNAFDSSLPSNYCGLVFRVISPNVQTDTQLRSVIQPWGIWATLSSKSIIATTFSHTTHTDSTAPLCLGNPTYAVQHYIFDKCVQIDTTRSIKSIHVGNGFEQQMCMSTDCSYECITMSIVYSSDMSNGVGTPSSSSVCVTLTTGWNAEYGPVMSFNSLSSTREDSQSMMGRFSAPVIAAFVIGTLLIFFVLCNSIWIFLKRRRQRQQPRLSLRQQPQTAESSKIVWYNIVSSSQANLLSPSLTGKASGPPTTVLASVPPSNAHTVAKSTPFKNIPSKSGAATTCESHINTSKPSSANAPDRIINTRSSIKPKLNAAIKVLTSFSSPYNNQQGSGSSHNPAAVVSPVQDKPSQAVQSLSSPDIKKKLQWFSGSELSIPSTTHSSKETNGLPNLPNQARTSFTTSPKSRSPSVDQRPSGQPWRLSSASMPSSRPLQSPKPQSESSSTRLWLESAFQLHLSSTWTLDPDTQRQMQMQVSNRNHKGGSGVSSAEGIRRNSTPGRDQSTTLNSSINSRQSRSSSSMAIKSRWCTPDSQTVANNLCS
ncbi:hypothetical protein BATDEDRAFT_28650 [Batrachochytrium dendrobatidis JAM81]|uniref:Uncharacterized protein n=1 Tax=Batrachochytrium dendrobatidis (strain JAM81 / FGSC 10211) TaxID=684364 RepID=F4PEN7_BATDJ|nr:uncharacterized protein BATDEDRAFT_28650 [Batrachochytrium dendrobatidis JAM81]EGF76282.1 hypothetical protein BATDEDRAFT_28650 [Batrachochytrium dendrobatidis JAM81]|eukprot:XP_006683056.1 hypothetical protein BATDEDRAFT_28650 [Batrachochytrium dendrobatidis JAM81]